MSKRLLTFAALCASALISGCKSELSADEVADTTGSYTAAILTEAATSQDALGSLESLASVDAGLSAFASAFAAVPGISDLNGTMHPASALVAREARDPAAPQTFLERARAWFATPPYRADGAGLAVGVARPALTRDEADAIARYLKTHIFTKENLESASGDTAVFAIGSDDLCPSGCADAAHIDALDLRLQATRRPDDGLDLAFLFGPGKDALFMLELRKNSVAVVVDLAEARSAAIFLSTVQCVAPCQAEEIPPMSGVVAVKAQKNAPGDLTLSAAVRQEVVVTQTNASGAFYGFSTAAKNPVASVQIVAPAKKLVVSVDLGKTVVSAPYEPEVPLDPMVPGPMAGRQLTYTLGGVGYAFTIDEGVAASPPTFTVKGIGLGTEAARLEIAGDAPGQLLPLYRLALNEYAGFATYDVTVTVDPLGMPIFTFDAAEPLPLAVDLEASLDFGVVAGDEHVPSWAMDETYRLQISNGASLAPFRASVDPVTAEPLPGGIRLLDGTLTLFDLSGNLVQSDATSSALACLLPANAIGEQPSLVRYFAAGACP